MGNSRMCIRDVKLNNMQDQEHYDKCVICGKAYDMRDLGDVLYHGFGECETGNEKKDINTCL